MKYNTVIIGGGICGLTAAAEAAKMGLSVLLLEAMYTGGMAIRTKKNVDCPLFPEGTTGEELTDTVEKAALAAGARLFHERVTDLSLEDRVKTVITDKGSYEADTVIIASGLRLREMGLENERALNGLGIFKSVAEGSRAVSGKKVAVWGTGTDAAEEALALAELCTAVYLICPEQRLAAGKKYTERIKNTPKIKLCENTLIAGVNEGMFLLEGMTVINRETTELDMIPVEAVFVAPETEPDTDFLLGHVRMTDDGAVIVNENMETDVSGVFAAGAVRAGTQKNVADAAADAVRAARAANAYITESR